MSRLPDSRHDIEARDADGRPVRLVRSISQKLYRCPGCGAEIAIGEEHVLVLTPEAEDGYPHHHWHRTCAAELLTPELRGGHLVRSRGRG